MSDSKKASNTPTAKEELVIRREKLAELRKQGNAYPNKFKRHEFAKDIQDHYAHYSNELLDQENKQVTVAGRIMMRRVMGKASFIQLQDMSGRIQVYCRKEALAESVYDQFKKWDLGDIVGVQGHLFKTKTGELTIQAKSIELITKSVRPLPDKYHGLHDMEIRYRKRYLDLMVNEKSRQAFLMRSRIVQRIREFFIDRRYIEVETPMMQVLPGGAAAKPFITHHNALDMQLYLRVAPELYLKRLVVGGFERVFEINRNFRNEGLSTQHNPEFTMLEFYQAYADYNDMMTLSEELLQWLCHELCETMQLSYQGNTIDFSIPFKRLSVKQAILQYNPSIKVEELENIDKARTLAKKHEIEFTNEHGLGKIQLELFEKTVEHQLMQPTFITAYPTEVSPLARRNEQDENITDRFELFIAGREIANGFSELNDPDDQAERFKKQMLERQSGDEEAMVFDADYIQALEYGLPPTAGEGIGIDRLVMLFTDAPSIRDVFLFPHMRQKEE
ncbi:MAG: lysine--tRNA ligase [Pseudomonadota bacterium]